MMVSLAACPDDRSRFHNAFVPLLRCDCASTWSCTVSGLACNFHRMAYAYARRRCRDASWSSMNATAASMTPLAVLWWQNVLETRIGNP